MATIKIFFLAFIYACKNEAFLAYRFMIFYPVCIDQTLSREFTKMYIVHSKWVTWGTSLRHKVKNGAQVGHKVIHNIKYKVVDNIPLNQVNFERLAADIFPLPFCSSNFLNFLSTFQNIVDG